MNDPHGEQLGQMLREEYETLSDAGAIEIRCDVLAAHLQKRLDPNGVSPVLITYAAVLEFRQLARAICRRKVGIDEEAEAVGQQELWDGQLQPRYPAIRNSTEVYVLRENLSAEERRANSARLRATGISLMRHADALDAETDALIARGEFQTAA